MTDQNVRLFIGGDFCGVGRSVELIEKQDCHNLFEDLLPLIQYADLSILNLESPLTESEEQIVKTGPALKAPLSTAKFLKIAGFDLACLANNHILDFGYEGLNNTLTVLNNAGIDTVGAGLNKIESSAVYLKEVKNSKIAVINIAENEWSTLPISGASANALDLPLNYKDIKSSKESGYFTIVILHGGNEYYRYPSPNFQKVCRFFADVGANLIVCHHTHCVSGFEDYNGARIYYGLGNFVFDNKSKRNSDWNIGMAIQVEIGRSIQYSEILFRQSDAGPGLSRLVGNEAMEQMESVKQINSIIADSVALEVQFEKFSEESGRQYMNYWQPFSNRYFYALYKRGYLPSFLSVKKYKYYLNLIRCEAHRETLVSLFSKKVK